MNFYIVVVKNKCGTTEQKEFEKYREALCFATNYDVVAQSKIVKDKCVVNEFKG
ncbi:hypothetical protein [Enterococcus sp. CSURQ0835]|uniref:hypothetical protein n=1 Tax=Enterococcus sp. CSURQ0835 TaxID=2681394 RepID=UPI00190F8A66|nr:hypothetical protein [Enterococcus sp. CSURQ0835]